MLAAASCPPLQETAVRYLRVMRRVDAKKLKRIAKAPRVTLAFGAGGVAYAHSFAEGHVEGACRAQASRWSRASKRMTATWDRKAELVSDDSFWYGPDGLSLVVLDDTKRSAKRVARFNAIAETKLLDELTRGRAGYVLAALSAHRATGDDRYLESARRIAHCLLTSPDARPRVNGVGFAHGESGVLFAVLRLLEVAKETIPDHVMKRLIAVGESESAGALDGLSLAMRGSWCNGTSGTTLLWVRAFEQTGDRRFLSWATAAARASADAAKVDVTSIYGNLCCGWGGRAYACLAMHRIRPKDGWRERAIRLATRAVGTNAIRWEMPHGLLRGYPGLVCLAADLASPVPRGFPLIEA